ncbi:MAG TPA: hypothetical protein VH186_28410 [Chloroflexia bacterium]|nr:hypothetical protein [Chloroflexia bacterium]
MANKEQQELIVTGLAAVALGAGSGFALLPKLMGRAFGMNKAGAEQAGSMVAVRGLGVRDFAFGLGLLLARKNSESRSLLLKLLAFCMAGDTFACFMAMRKPEAKFTTFLGGVASIATGVVAWIASQNEE